MFGLQPLCLLPALLPLKPQVSGGFTDMVLQAYTGSCNSLTAIACDDNNGPAITHKLSRQNTRRNHLPSEQHQKTYQQPTTTEEIWYLRIRCIGTLSSRLSCIGGILQRNGRAAWTNKSGWVNYASIAMCTWFGVVCNTAGRVTALNLGTNHLVGSIPSSLTGLTELTRLNLYSNTLSGSLPNFLDDFVLLEYVDLGNNTYSGSLPSTFGDIGNLRTLYLDHNTLSGNTALVFDHSTHYGFVVEQQQLQQLHSHGYETLPRSNLRLEGEPFAGRRQLHWLLP